MRKFRNGDQREGFALVLALSMMAFVLVLLLSMTLLVRVETTSSRIALNQLRAKESARLALMMAIGDLQRYAGPDQRVTARAEILGSDTNDNPNYREFARFWTGVWDTSAPSAPPTWLVSGDRPDPKLPIGKPVNLESSFSTANNNATDNFLPTQTQRQTLNNGQYAWWVSDEGIKAAVDVQNELSDTLNDLPADDSYLDYNLNSKKVLTARHDPTFDYPRLFDINDQTTTFDEALERATSLYQINILAADKSEDARDSINSAFKHDHTLRNRFVLSDTKNGGLKKDLSFLKTLDPNSVAQSQLDTLYSEPNGLITSETVKLIRFRGNPTAYPTDEIMGMQVSEDTVALVEAKANHFDLLPVITELQVSLGVASDGGDAKNSETPDSPLYLVHKVYLELWNPYTIPMMIGDDQLDPDLGFSDIAVEIKNLPSFSIVNDDSGASVAGTLPDLRLKWSDYRDPKILRPGMVFRTSFPLDPGDPNDPPHGDNNSGTIQMPLGGSITGSRSDDYIGTFTFSGSPVEIILYAINANGEEREMTTIRLENYDNFTTDYDYNSFHNRASWLKRVPTSTSTAAFGMNTNSLEVSGYAFAFRYRMLDEQEVSNSTKDISNWLSQFDIRNRTIEVDLSAWDLDDAWTSTPPSPYDFRLNDIDAELGAFDPDFSFKGDHFYHYETSNEYTGRRDRIARFIDLPISEIVDLGALRALKYRDFNANAIGNPWGGKLNQHYDRYYLSTLPDPAIVQWDGSSPLANGRLISHSEVPQLSDTEASSHLLIQNGFNLNSTSKEAWKSVLSSKNYPEDTFEFRYERTDSSNAPKWGILSDPLNRITFTQPQASIHNVSDKPDDSSYDFVTRASTVDYLDAFSIDSLNWLDNLQHPAFHQSAREMTENDVDALSTAVVKELQTYTSNTGHPPLSMSEWINSGLLQAAINSVSELNNRDDNNDLIPSHTPANISQATLLNTLGQFAFVRSDTFRVRAYGSANHPLTKKVLAEAYLEAVLQRLPDEHPNNNFGRAFEIVNVQWIAPTK